MIICPKCGEKMEDEAFFCANCGAMMKSNVPPEIRKRIEARRVRQEETGEKPPVQQVVQEQTQPVAQPVTQPTVQPVTKPTTRPVARPTVQPATKPVTQPVAQPTVHPATKPTVQPVTKPVTQPAAKPVTQSAAQPVTQPAAQSAVQPMAQPITQSAAKPRIQSEIQAKENEDARKVQEQKPQVTEKPAPPKKAQSVPSSLPEKKEEPGEPPETPETVQKPQRDRNGMVAGLIMVGIILIALIGSAVYYFMGGADENEFIGTYYPSSAKRGNEEMSPDSVLGEGFSVVLQKGEEAVFNIPGSTTEGRWRVTRSGRFSFISSSMDIRGKLKNRLLTLELNGIELLMTWTADGTETASETESETETENESRIPVESETGSESQPDKQSGIGLFEGDWYGVTLFSGCTGDYIGNDGLKAETIARLVFDEAGNCEPFIAMALGEKSKNLNFRNLVMVWDAASDTMSLEGNCLKGDISGGTRVSVSESGALGFVTDIVENQSKVTLTVCLRRLDEDWKIDDVLSPNAETLEYYKDMNLETIATSFGIDISELPKQGYKTPDLSSDEDALTASYGGWDESLFGVGVTSATTMQKE